MRDSEANDSYCPPLRADYKKTRCPNSDLLCREQTIWLEQSIFLGPRKDIDDIARAFEKIYENRELLNASKGTV